MLLPIPEEVLQAQARDRALDVLLGSLGVSAAVASAGFAVYMAAFGPALEPATRAAPLMTVAGPPSHEARTLAPPEPDAAVAGIDFDPTGSIPGIEAAADQDHPDPRAILSDFAVRDAFDGTALVEAHGTLQVVQKGTVLAGVGTVTGVSKRGGAWSVSTTGGTILQRR